LFSFCGRGTRVDISSFAFGLDELDQLRDKERVINFTGNELKTLNPNDLSVPPITSPRDKKLLIEIHQSIPVLINLPTNTNPHKARYSRGLLNSSSDSTLFAEYTFEKLVDQGHIDEYGRWSDDFAPLIEGKLIASFNHRFGTFEGTDPKKRFGKKAEAKGPLLWQLQDPEYQLTPRFWLKLSEAQKLYERKRTVHSWSLCFRHVCRSIVDARTAQIAIVPKLPISDSCGMLLVDAY
jgi:hypothetical protein